MSLAIKLIDYVRAAFSGLYIETFEPDEALREIQTLCRQENWNCAVWDIDTGLSLPGQNPTNPGVADPLAAIRSLPAMATPNGTSLLVLKNFQRFLSSTEIMQAMQNELQSGKASRTFIVILAPTVQLPVELERQFVILQHDLPSHEQLGSIIHELLADEPEGVPTDLHSQSLLDAAAGLTRQEAEGAFALSLARHGELRADAIWEIKSQSLRKQNLLTLSRGGETFSQLGGMDALKDFCRSALRPGRRVKARGALLLSPPGCGKSQFCKALGNEVGRPVLSLDIGALMAGIVGETERNVRNALKIADAMSPCILFVDELEKGLSGVGGSGDSGVSTRLFGSLLTWLSDHQTDVFFIGTANSFNLPPEFTRAGRLDAMFFIDLPGSTQRRMIWDMYRCQFEIHADQSIPKDADWSGAEIKSCCRLSALLDVSLKEAASNVVPVAQTAIEAVTKLREWASGRCLSADRPGLYVHTGATEGNSRRKVCRDTSAN